MLIETQVVRSKSELAKELQGLPVTKAITYRDMDHKAQERDRLGAPADEDRGHYPIS